MPYIRNPERQLSEVSRRDFLKYLIASFLILFGLPPVFANESLESSTLEELMRNLEQIIGSQYAGVSLQVVRRGEVIENRGVNAEQIFPVASAFKAPVLLYYLQSFPQELWQLDKNSAVYNMIVYSHNSATSAVLGAVGDLRRSQRGEVGNNLELFNDFLISLGVAPMLSGWGYGPATDGQGDQRATGTMDIGGSGFSIGNATTLQNLSHFYTRFLQLSRSRSNISPEVTEAFEHLLSIADLRYLSPLEQSFIGQRFLGKDGYLSPNTFGNLGSTRIDAGILKVDAETQLVYSLGTVHASEAVANQLAGTAVQHVRGQPSRSIIETSASLREKLPYFFTGDSRIDQEGPITPNTQQITFLNDALRNVTRPPLGQVVTVNIFDGSVSSYSVNDRNEIVDSGYHFPSLVGERLPYGNPSYSEQFRNSPYASDGSNYDSQKGILNTSRPLAMMPQHTFTTPMIGVFEGATAEYGFGGLQTRVPVPFLVMRSLNATSSGVFNLSSLHSEVTVHAIPQLPTNDESYVHYSQRDFLARMVAGYVSTVGHRPLGYDSYWSHGCINILPEHYAVLSQLMEQVRRSGKSVVVILGYRGFMNWADLCLPATFNSANHPLFESNMARSTGAYFYSQ